MAKKRVFVRFDFDNDKVLKDFVVGQAAHSDSPFEIVDMSLKEAAPMKTWEEKALAAIQLGGGVPRERAFDAVATTSEGW